MNIIIDANGLRKNQCAVPKHRAGKDSGLTPYYDEMAGDVFLENCPSPHDNIHLPKFIGPLEGYEKIRPEDLWEEATPKSEVAAIKAEKKLAECIAKRRARYKEEADPMYLDIIYEAHKAGVEPDLTPWVELKDQIKADLPKPV